VTGLPEALAEVELIVGEVTDTEPHAGARAPSTLLHLDLGGHGSRQAAFAGEHGTELVGQQVVCALRGDEVLVLCAQSHAHGAVPLQPGRRVEPGTPVG
jgi:hypothetical protein